VTRPLLSLLALALVVLAGVAAAPAGAVWSAPAPVVPDAAAGRPVAAGNSHGSEAFAWIVTTKRAVRSGRQSGLASYVRARVRLPNGRLGATQTLSPASGLVTGPQIGVDDAGDVTAVWVRAGRHLEVVAAYRPHGRRFGPAVVLGRSGHFNDARPALAVGPFGDAVVAWNAGDAVRVVRRGVGPCHCFGAPRDERRGTDQTVAIGPLGSAYIAWAAEVRTAPDEVHTRLQIAAFARSGRALGHEHFISTNGDASEPALAVGRDGGATVAWRASQPTGGEAGEPAALMVATTVPGGPVSALQTLSTVPSERPQLRVTSRGEAVLAWTQFPATAGPQVSIAVRPAGAALFGAPAAISPPGVDAANPSLATDAAGATHLLYDAGGRGAVTHVRPAGSIFGAPTTLPGTFSLGFLQSAGARITAVGGLGGRTVVSDWAA
jgi:hypothetical protein